MAVQQLSLFDVKPLEKKKVVTVQDGDTVYRAGEKSGNRAKIEDFGEIIPGAKKDIWGRITDTLGVITKEKIQTMSMSKLFPEPKYQRLLDKGFPEDFVGLLHATRDILQVYTAKKRKIPDKEAEVIKQIIDFLKSLPKDEELLKPAMEKLKDITASVVAEEIFLKKDLYKELGHEYSLKNYTLRRCYQINNFYTSTPAYGANPEDVKPVFRLSHNKTYKTLAVCEVTKDQARLNAFRNECVDILRNDLFSAQQKEKEKAAKRGKSEKTFEVLSRNFEYYIGVPVGNHFALLKDGFKTKQEAYLYKEQHQDELWNLYNQFTNIPEERREVNRVRKGKDIRFGKDVDQMDFTEAFAFRGVQFGNWVDNDLRQKNLNDAYESLVDLAEILGVNTQDVSLNHSLALSFGARGGGGKAIAHYEPEYQVINLTKNKGRGALAHEWFHALDNYCARKAGWPGEYLTKIAGTEKTKGLSLELRTAFKDLQFALMESPLMARSQFIDAFRSKSYWSSIEEMAARCFEKYCIVKLAEQGYENDYLANVVTEKEWEKMADGRPYLYPIDEEMENLIPVFDRVCAVVAEQVLNSEENQYIAPSM